MNTELSVLFWTIILGLAHLLLATAVKTSQRGIKWNLSARETQEPPLRGMAGRLDRAFGNFKETFPFFIAAVLLVLFSKTNGDLSAKGSLVYLSGRILYVPLYAFGINGFRTAVWAISLLGILMVLAQFALY